MITASSLGYPRTALTFLNRPRVVALFSGLTQMWASRRKTEEARSQIREQWRTTRESLNKPHADRLACPDRRDLPLPRQGPDPGAARPRRVERRSDALGGPPLRDRKRPLRLRPGRAEMAAETAFPDADAGRMAGRPAHPFRRSEQRPLD